MSSDKNSVFSGIENLHVFNFLIRSKQAFALAWEPAELLQGQTGLQVCGQRNLHDLTLGHEFFHLKF